MLLFSNVCKKKSMKVQEEKIYNYALSRIFAYEPLQARQLIEKTGGAAALFGLDDEGLEALLGPYHKLLPQLKNPGLESFARELEDICSKGFRYLCHYENDFPSLLNQCEDAPLGLFIQSESTDAQIFSRELTAIVGTRDMSPYGAEWCGRIVHALSECKGKHSIVSGLAYGVDITAQTQALECGLPTIAVLGTGIGNIYPSAHNLYAEKIVRSPGSAIISEYPPVASVSNINFLRRNRIIAGLCGSTILIESRIKGGGMSTARLAASYNRNVYALPGRNEDTRSQGCNLLIHSNIAEAIIGCGELLKSMGLKKSGKGSMGGPGRKSQSVREFYDGCMDRSGIVLCTTLYEYIRQHRGCSIEDAAADTGIEFRKALSIAHMLENDGFIDIDLLQNCMVKRGA